MGENTKAVDNHPTDGFLQVDNSAEENDLNLSNSQSGLQGQRAAIVSEFNDDPEVRIYRRDPDDDFRHMIAPIEKDLFKYRNHRPKSRKQENARPEDYSIEIGDIADWENEVSDGESGIYEPDSVDGVNRSNLVWDQRIGFKVSTFFKLIGAAIRRVTKVSKKIPVPSRYFGRKGDVFKVDATQDIKLEPDIKERDKLPSRVEKVQKRKQDGVFKTMWNITPHDKPLLKRRLIQSNEHDNLPKDEGFSPHDYPPDLPADELIEGSTGVRELRAKIVIDPKSPGQLAPASSVLLPPEKAGIYHSGGWLYDGVQRRDGQIHDVLFLDGSIKKPNEDGSADPMVDLATRYNSRHTPKRLDRDKNPKDKDFIPTVLTKIRHDAHFGKGKNLTGRICFTGTVNAPKPPGLAFFGEMALATSLANDPKQTGIFHETGEWCPLICIPFQPIHNTDKTPLDEPSGLDDNIYTALMPDNPEDLASPVSIGGFNALEFHGANEADSSYAAFQVKIPSKPSNDILPVGFEWSLKWVINWFVDVTQTAGYSFNITLFNKFLALADDISDASAYGSAAFTIDDTTFPAPLTDFVTQTSEHNVTSESTVQLTTAPETCRFGSCIIFRDSLTDGNTDSWFMLPESSYAYWFPLQDELDFFDENSANPLTLEQFVDATNCGFDSEFVPQVQPQL